MRDKQKMNFQERILIAACVLLVIVALGLYVFDERAQIETKVQETTTVHIEEPTISQDVQSDITTQTNQTQSSTETKVQEAGSQNLSWKLALVNRDHPLTVLEEPELAEVEDGYRVDKRIQEPLMQMLSDARDDGVQPIICSAYRSNKKQTTLFKNKVKSYMDKGYTKEEAYEKAEKIVARPGTSEHAMGLAVDIISRSYQTLDKKQEQTPEAKWLKKHCAEYGFILRYPVDKTEITGIIYEPWHYRYVGVKAAKEIMEKGICLEEYLEEKNAYN